MSENNNVENNVDFQVIYDALDRAIELDAIVYYTAPHALYIEYPTSYGNKMPPVNEIEKWVSRNIQTDEPENIAFQISKKIQEEGTEGVFFLNRAGKDMENSGANSILSDYEGKNITPELFDNILNDLASELKDKSQEYLKRSQKVDTRDLINSASYEILKGEDIKIKEIN